ncbi:hypothetical protein I7I50_10426 [Histoplasma capsulatum G186AR]|uniref:Uncharacterized protein n=1 Tax=Ajellomyces capsulatus TaxID=5037 RepID=A0A8H8D8J7_AJECA|nr:hypothetical protein I7I52_01665 [Histoplasma capsulatum]QSS69215.1 hypothetical protein I7I50_10426 [Histoplasma capsulatum G186AR]
MAHRPACFNFVQLSAHLGLTCRLVIGGRWFFYERLPFPENIQRICSESWEKSGLGPGIASFQGNNNVDHGGSYPIRINVR